jgi:hypothetical protein
MRFVERFRRFSLVGGVAGGAIALTALAACGAGCGGGGAADGSGGGGPLEGTWSVTTSGGGVTATTTITLNGDGTLTETVSSTGCTGMDSLSGYSWSSTSATVSVTGEPTCTGMLVCTVAGMTVSEPCSGTGGGVTGTCNYTLSNGNDTLTLTNCGSGTSSVTFTRK